MTIGPLDHNRWTTTIGREKREMREEREERSEKKESCENNLNFFLIFFLNPATYIELLLITIHCS